jgi:hypothetical protein
MFRQEEQKGLARQAHIARVAGYIAAGLENGLHPLEIAEWYLDAANGAARVDTRTRLLRECDYKPVCWLCGLLIPLDEQNFNADDAISLDHVIPVCKGGTKENDNIRLAHRLCNTLRHAKNPHKRTKRRLEWMKAALRCREEKESGLGIDISIQV